MGFSGKEKYKVQLRVIISIKEIVTGGLSCDTLTLQVLFPLSAETHSVLAIMTEPYTLAHSMLLMTGRST
jgi:hypothetical protein